MKRRLVSALVLLGLLVVVLLFNRGNVDLALLPGNLLTINTLKSVVFLSFMCVGVVIGVMLR